MSEMDKLQADAVNRARDMYRRSQNYNVNSFPNGYNGNIREQAQKANDTENVAIKNVTGQNVAGQNVAGQKTQRQQIQSAVQKTAEEKPNDTVKEEDTDTKAHENTQATSNLQQSGNIRGDFLDILLSDKERTLIILLIALLNEEGANTSLLLALMYLIM